MVKVKLLKSLENAGHRHAPGEVVTLDPDTAQMVIEWGVAEQVAVKKPGKVPELPAPQAKE